MEVNLLRTRQENSNITYPKSSKYIIGLDTGYSSMKVFTESLYFAFPTFVKAISEDDLKSMIPSGQDILYRDNDTNEIFLVGRCAQAIVSDTDTEETEAEWFSQDRFNKPSIKACINTAIGYALRHNDGRDIFVQAGLPSSDLRSQTNRLITAITRKANFSLRIGMSKEWEDFNYEISEENVDVMEQPKGALQSAITTVVTDPKTGEPVCVLSPAARSVLTGNTLVMDIGFGTFDYLGFKQRIPSCKESKRECGMRAVLKLACDKIYNATGKDIRVTSIQNALETGVISVRPIDGGPGSKKVDISSYVEEALNEVFDKAIVDAESITSYFEGYQNIVIAGGTGDAWSERIKDYFKVYEDINVYISNETDTNIAMMYSTVRGYYVSRWFQLANR